MLDDYQAARTEILVHELRRHSGSTAKDNTYEMRTVFGGAAGNHDAHIHFGLF
jgi:hypothetical protein